MATIAENIQTLRSIKSDIKNAIIQKGGSVTDAFGTYAQAITNLPSGGGGGTEMEDGLVTRTLSVYSNDRVSRVGTGVFFSCSKLTYVNLPNCTTVGNYAFSFCSVLPSIYLPLCTTVGYAAFQQCSSLVSVNLPNCTYIANNAFLDCASLLFVNLPLCEYIGGGAFESCHLISSVSLPNCSLLGGAAFAFCNNLKEVYLNRVTSVTKRYDNTFSRCSNLTSIYVPASLVDAFKTAQYWSSISTKIVAYTGA